MEIKINRFPFPLSVNEAYIPIPMRSGNRARLIVSKKLQQYQAECQRFAFFNRDAFNKIRIAILDWESIAIKVEFYFPRNEVFTKENKLHKFDVANFEKPLLDCLSKIISVDDSHFNLVSLEKKITSEPQKFLNLTISKHIIECK